MAAPATEDTADATAAAKKTVVEDAATRRTEMTAPFFSKTGQEQWKAITEEENARGRERMKDPNNQGTFNRMRNGAVGLLPGYFRRGFSDAFDDDDSRGKKAKKVDDFPIPDGSRKRDPLPMFKVFLDQGNEKFDATPWSRLDGDYTTFETSPVTQVPLPARKPTETYWRWALPFVSKDAWDGKKVWTDGEKPMAWGPRTLDSWERLFVGAPDSTPEPHLQDKFRLYADKEYPAKLSSLPPPWTKEGVEYVKKNGIGDFVAEFVGDVRFQPYTGEQGSSSRIDGKWGTYSPFFKDDPLKDDTIAKTLAALSDAASQRYTSTDGTGGVPWLRSNVLTEGSLFGLLWSKGGRGKKKNSGPRKGSCCNQHPSYLVGSVL
jgi:hypothetical protein